MELHESQAWVGDLFYKIMAIVGRVGVQGSFAFEWEEEEETIELIIFPLAVESIGGSNDGDRGVPPFTVDLQSLSSLFNDITHFQWCPHAFGNVPGPGLEVAGCYQGHQVALTLLAFPPESGELEPKDNDFSALLTGS